MKKHISHLYEDLSLTLDDIYQIYAGLINETIVSYEKFDGQNLSFFNDGSGVRFFRNKGEYEAGGLDLDELKEKFLDHPAQKTFDIGGEIIDQAFDHVTIPSEHYINCEILHVNNPNVIQYKKNYIVVHNFPHSPSKEVKRMLPTTESGWDIVGPKKIMLQNEGRSALQKILHFKNKKETLRFFVEKKLRKKGKSLSYFTKKEQKKIIAEYMQPIEEAVREAGGIMLSPLCSSLVEKRGDEIARLKTAIEDCVKTDGDNPKLQQHFEKINMDYASPIEGIVFEYPKNGKLYKLTGMFAPINQILGWRKYQTESLRTLITNLIIEINQER